MLSVPAKSFAQEIAANQEIKIPRIAVFAALYLDSAFDAAGNYRYGRNMPWHIKSGLEFYEGVAFALDSLNKEGLQAKVQVYDTKGKSSVFELADSGVLDSTDLIIGAVNGSEYLDLATVAKEKHIPFVSASYPNDGGVRNNPFLIIVNSKLNTHLLALYNYILRNHGTGKITMFRRKSAADDRVTKVIQSLNSSASGPVLNIREVILNAGVTPAAVTAALDKDRQNLVICGSLDDSFGRLLISTLAPLTSTYKITLVGMPTWETYRELDAPQVKPLAVIYSAAFFDPGQANPWVAEFSKRYAGTTYSYPSESAFRGFELMYLFTHLLDQNPDSLILDKLTDPNFRVLTDFDFKPVRLSSNGTTPDYYENKHIYILNRQNGILSEAK